MPSKDASTDCDAKDESLELTWSLGVAVVVVFILSGVMCIVLSIGIFQFAAAHFNFSSRTSRFFSQSAYAVYLIHPFVICPVSYSFIEIMRVYEGVDIVFCDGSNSSKTHFGHTPPTLGKSEFPTDHLYSQHAI